MGAMTEYYDKKWNMNYDKLVEFKRTNGHCMVPKKYKEDTSLGVWVCTQRQCHNKNKIRPDRERMLDEIGFAWTVDAYRNFKPDDKLWHQQCEKLVKFKRIYGHCMVPFRYEQDKSLGIWVSMQRKYHKNNKLRQDRKTILDQIGFAWKADDYRTFKPDDKLWRQQYEKLVEYKRINGNSMVPFRYEKDKSLGNWVRTQRVGHANNKLLPDRKELLDALDFVWKADTHVARASTTNNNSDSEAFTRPSSVGLPDEAPPEESELAQGRVRNNCPASNRKRPSTCLAKAGRMAACTKQRGSNATSSCWSSVNEDAGGGLVEEDLNPSLVSSVSALIGSDPYEEVVQEEATPESEQMAASTRTNQRGATKATGTSCGSVVKEDGGNRDEEDSKPSLVTSSSALLTGSYPDQEVVEEEATTPDEIPSGWTRVKLEPDC